METFNNDENEDDDNYLHVATKAFNKVILDNSLNNSDEDTNSNELIAKAQESATTAVRSFLLQTQPNYNEANSIAKINSAVMYATNKYKKGTQSTVGGKRRKSRKSRKTRKGKKSRRTRKSRKGRKSRRR